jgi:hypothetical protein
MDRLEGDLKKSVENAPRAEEDKAVKPNQQQGAETLAAAVDKAQPQEDDRSTSKASDPPQKE